MKCYVVYDGRARFDEPRASILESNTEKGELSDWTGVDAVLFEYDISEDGELINGKQIRDFSVSIS